MLDERWPERERPQSADAKAETLPLADPRPNVEGERLVKVNQVTWPVLPPQPKKLESVSPELVLLDEPVSAAKVAGRFAVTETAAAVGAGTMAPQSAAQVRSERGESADALLLGPLRQWWCFLWNSRDVRADRRANLACDRRHSRDHEDGHSSIRNVARPCRPVGSAVR